MKKLKEFFSKVPRWLKVAVPLVLVVFIAVFAVIASIPKSYPEGAIVQGRNESYGIYYNNRAFVEYSTLDKFAEVTEARIDVNKSLLINGDEDYYSIKGIDPDYAIVRRNVYAGLTLYLSLSEIPLFKGEDIYEDIFHISENTENYCYLKVKPGRYGGYDYYRLKGELNDVFREFFDYINKADFFYKSDVEEMKDIALESNPYYIEAEFENKFIYGVRLYEGGYIIPCGAGDICQKIPEEMYDKLKSIMDNTENGEFIDNTRENYQEKSLDEFDNLGELEKFVPAYIPEKAYVFGRGLIDVNFELSAVYVYYGYDKETGEINGAGEIHLGYEAVSGNNYRIKIVKNGFENYSRSKTLVKPEDFTEEWLLENYEDTYLIHAGSDKEHRYYHYYFTVDFEGFYVTVDSYKVEPEDIYKIVKSINTGN